MDIPSDLLEHNLPIYLFARVLQECWTKFSAEEPERWTAYAPGNGHALFSALLAQEVYGGFVAIGLVFGERYHYWNVLNDGTQIDFCREHIGDRYTLERLGHYANRRNLPPEVLKSFYQFREMYRAVLAFERMETEKEEQHAAI